MTLRNQFVIITGGGILCLDFMTRVIDKFMDIAPLDLADTQTDEQRRKEQRDEELAKMLNPELQSKISAAVNSLYQQELGYVPAVRVKEVRSPKFETKHDIGSPQYKARVDTLCYILRNPEYTTHLQCKSLAWKEVTTLPYIKYIFDYGFSTEHLRTLRCVSHEVGIKLPKVITSVAVIKAAKEAYIKSMTQENESLRSENELLRELSNYEFMFDRTNNALIYKEFVIPWSTSQRCYHLKISGKDVKIPKGAKDRFVDTFRLLDKLSEL